MDRHLTRRCTRPTSGRSPGAIVGLYDSLVPRSRKTSGLSLLELLVVLAIVAGLAALALPLYRGYVETAKEGALVSNIATLALFQEDHKLRRGTYLLEAASTAEITAAIRWHPGTSDRATYRIADGGNGTYHVTATDEDGTQVCLKMPQRVRC
ncbi:MAG: prepilin-type N-terminal cleavage/methylation domain-containing protein [Gammaproteobacteria bacterium]|nr:prepilin-type N-terminal cleavage/methylation domain-containing protein [Gammaproteobacteria bacterium]